MNSTRWLCTFFWSLSIGWKKYKSDQVFAYFIKDRNLRFRPFSRIDPGWPLVTSGLIFWKLITKASFKKSYLSNNGYVRNRPHVSFYDLFMTYMSKSLIRFIKLYPESSTIFTAMMMFVKFGLICDHAPVTIWYTVRNLTFFSFFILAYARLTLFVKICIGSRIYICGRRSGC